MDRQLSSNEEEHICELIGGVFCSCTWSLFKSCQLVQIPLWRCLHVWGLRIAEAREWKTFSLKNTRRLPRRYNDILSNSGNSSLPMWSEIKIIETWCYWSCRLPLLVKERKEQIVQRKVSGFSLSCRSDMNPQKRRKFRKENLKDSSIIK